MQVCYCCRYVCLLIIQLLDRYHIYILYIIHVYIPLGIVLMVEIRRTVKPARSVIALRKKQRDDSCNQNSPDALFLSHRRSC